MLLRLSSTKRERTSLSAMLLKISKVANREDLKVKNLKKDLKKDANENTIILCPRSTIALD